MRKLMVLIVALAACSKAETPAADTTAMAPAMAAPAALTAADIAGTWKGVNMGETSDSVTGRWTAMSASDTSGSVTSEGSTEAIPYTVVFDADSMIATSAAFTNPADAKGPKLMFRSIGRLKDGKLMGTSVNMLASKPDSVVLRERFEATRAP
jgi:hypothetical protein